MGALGFIPLCLLIGIVLRKTGRMDRGISSALNAFILCVSLPALALVTLHEARFEARMAGFISMAWILFGLAWAFLTLLSRLLGWERQTLGALLLTCGMANTSFVGFPLITALYGPEGLPTAVLIDQLGSFFVFSTLGLYCASHYSAAPETSSGWEIVSGRLRKIVVFPPFIAVIVGLLLRPIPYPPALLDWLGKLSATMSPLALVSIGLQMQLETRWIHHYRRELAIGLGFKLLLAPLAIFALIAGVFGVGGTELQITIVEAGMAPMVTATILAIEHGLAPELSKLMLVFGIPLSLLTAPMWAYLLRGH